MANSSDRQWLHDVLRPMRRSFREVFLISFFVNVLALAVPVFVLQIYDRVVFHAGISTLQGLVIGMALVLVFDYVLRNSRARILQTVALRVDVQTGRALFNRVMSLPLRALEAKPAPYWQSLFRDVEVVRNTVSGSSAILLCDLPFVFVFLGVIFIIAKPIAWVLALVFPIFIFIAWRSGNVLNSATQKERETAMNRDDLIGGIINGRTTIKALALDRAMRPMWEEKHAANIENSVHRGGKADAFTAFGQTLTLITTIGLTTVGAIAIINQELTIGALIATNMLSGRLLGPLNQLVNTWKIYTSFRQSVQRLSEVFSSEAERQESEVSLGTPKGNLTLENVVFSYNPEGAPIINDIKLSIKPSSLTALVGRNGSGKTTLIKLILGLYKPSSGRVLLDGADLAQFTRSELASWMGYVPQDCVVFAGTVRENISHGQPDAPDQEIIRAAKAAGVHDFIIDMPDGYATEIGEAGQRLSGGQRQRIAIARALVGKPSVVLMDEPSGSLDRQAEEELKRTLIELAKEHTVIIVTHSPILLQACDNLVALDKGRVALAGPTKDVLPRLFGRAPAASAPPAQPAAPAAAQQPAQEAKPQPQASPATPQQGSAPTDKHQSPAQATATPAKPPSPATPQTGSASNQIPPKPQPVTRPTTAPSPNMPNGQAAQRGQIPPHQAPGTANGSSSQRRQPTNTPAQQPSKLNTPQVKLAGTTPERQLRKAAPPPSASGSNLKSDADKQRQTMPVKGKPQP